MLSADEFPVDVAPATEPGAVLLSLPTRAENRRHSTADRAEASRRRLRWDDKGATKRTGYSIRAYVGLNGAGKSLAAVHDLVPGLRAGLPTLSTVRILDPHSGNDHPLYVRLNEWSQLLAAENAQVLFDEVQGIANSRASQGMPVQVQTLLHQLRRRNVALSWTSPSWARADLLIREVTRSVTVCRGYWKDQGTAGSWKANQLFRWITYDAADFTAWTDSAEEKLVGKNNAWLYRPAFTLFGKQLGRPSLAQELYDTNDAVDRIGETLDSGRCAHCGGARRADPCSCSDYVNRPAALAKKGAGRAGGHTHEH